MSAKKVLIIEDEGIVSSDLRSFLTPLGYTVTASVFSGEEALQYCRSDPPDAVLIDIGLQGRLDGIETARLLKKERQVPFIYITGFADEKTIGRARKTGPEGLLLKPIAEKELEKALERIFKKKKVKK